MNSYWQLVLGLALISGGVSQAQPDQDEVSFNRDIRPILSENCYHCHGPDDAKRSADLRLDVREDALDYAIVAGDADDSEVYQRVISDDPDALMPPADSKRFLSDQQKDMLRRWIDQGAKYESHWSFIPPEKPAGNTNEPTRAAIDRLVDAQITAHRLTRSEAADREILIRRVSFDLTGIPPTLDEIDAFVSDTDSDAFEKVIDRLLQSDRYGERMASDWLDVARYSDTYGYQVDRDRFVWPWRDWVIAAFNRNLSYDQFITEQIAGDLLPSPTRDQILATTFNRLHPQKVEGGSVPEEFRIEYVADRTQTVATGLLGLTYECCRCHSHKYDPITQTEYYQLSAFFDNIDEAGLYSYFTPSVPTPTLSLPNDDQKQQLESRGSALQSALVSLEQERANASARASKWLHDGRQSVTDSLAKSVLELSFDEQAVGRNESVPGVSGDAIKLTGDDAVKTKVGNFRRDKSFSVSLWMNTPDVKERAVLFHRSRAWTDAASRGYQLLLEDGKLSWSLIHFWPGNAIRIRAKEPISIEQWQHVVVTHDGSATAAGLAIFVNGDRVETEIVRDSLTKEITGGGGDNIDIGQRFRDRGFTHGSIDEFAVFETQLTELEISQLTSIDEPLPWIDQDPKNLSDVQCGLLESHYVQRIDSSFAEQVTDVHAKRKALFELMNSVDEIMVMKELPDRRPSYLLERGLYDNHGDQVQPATPAMLPKFPDDAPRDRLGLTQWMTAPGHPLTSRVAVNRLWQLCFGTGLVRTPEDFGSQGMPPTHPELMDVLAVDFQLHDWNIKWLLKEIMMSQTYRRASVVADEATVRQDPENVWLARFPSYRLPAEMLRDNVLAVGGRLVDKIGGPPVKPYEIEASFKPSTRSTGDGLYRRSLYTYWKRTGPAPAMLTFDAAKRDVCRVKRERTSSPLQAFVMLNGPQYIEAARCAAEKLITNHPKSIDDCLTDAYRMLTSQTPTPQQHAVLAELFNQQRERFAAEPDQVDAFLKVGDAGFAETIDKADLGALTIVVSTLMNFDMSVTKR